MSQNEAKETILQAFNRLNEKSGFEAVTVMKIVKEAGISRATFYRYFKDKYDVMNYNYSSMLERLTLSGKVHTMEDLFVLLLEEGKQNENILIPLFQSDGVNSFYSFLRNHSFVYAKTLAEAARPDHCLSEAELIQLRVLAGGAAVFFKDWLMGRCPLSAEEAGHALAAILPEFLKGNIFD